MNNLFNTENYPNKEPSSLLLGSRWVWKRPDISSAYPATDYTLKYLFQDASCNNTARTLIANKDGENHVIEITAEQSANIKATSYVVSVNIERDSDQQVINLEEIVIDIKSSNSGAYAHAVKVLVAVRAAIEGVASSEHLKVQINGRSLERFSHGELVSLEKEYSHRERKEKQKLGIKNGKPGNKRTRLRMSA